MHSLQAVLTFLWRILSIGQPSMALMLYRSQYLMDILDVRYIDQTSYETQLHCLWLGYDNFCISYDTSNHIFLLGNIFGDRVFLVWYIDGLVQGRHDSSALAMELRLSCTNPLICMCIDTEVNALSCSDLI